MRIVQTWLRKSLVFLVRSACGKSSFIRVKSPELRETEEVGYVQRTCEFLLARSDRTEERLFQ